MQENPVSRHKYIYGNDNPIKYMDPSGNISFSLGEITGILLGIGYLSAGEQRAFSTFALEQSHDREITWTGSYHTASITLPPFFNVGTWEVALSTEKIKNGPNNGIWLIADAGFSLGPLPYGEAISTYPSELPGRGHDFSLKTPSIFGSNGWYLSGLFNSLSAAAPNPLSPSEYLMPYSYSVYFMMGFGQGNLSLGDEYGIDIGITALTGLSIPLYLYNT
jgi:hypothetical protein